MQISVSGKGVDIGESLRSHVEERLKQGTTKYIDRVTSVQAVVAKDGHGFRVDIHGNVGTHAGVVVRSSATGVDVYAAADSAMEKIEKQLRRYKRKISDHQKEKNVSQPSTKARKYVLPADVGEQDEQAHNGTVIAEKPTDIETLSVSEAVMKMDLQDLPALMFYNAKHGGLNVVYRRIDGNISWVDPEGVAA